MESTSRRTQGRPSRESDKRFPLAGRRRKCLYLPESPDDSGGGTSRFSITALPDASSPAHLNDPGAPVTDCALPSVPNAPTSGRNEAIQPVVS